MFNGNGAAAGVATADYFRGRTNTLETVRLYQLQADWDGTGNFTNANSDITDYVLDLKARRGRNVEHPIRGRSQIGTMTVVLNNTSGIFSRYNSASLLSGLLKAGRLIHWRAISPSFFERWAGYIIDYELSKSGLATCTLTCRGVLSRVEKVKVNPLPDSGSLTGTIVGKILDAAGVASTLRGTIDVGQTTTSRWYINDRFTIDALRDMEETELGFILETKTGKISYQDRAYRVSGARLTSQATYSAANGASLPYIDNNLPAAGQNVINVAKSTVTPYTVGALADIWTLSGETPTIGAGQTKVWYAQVGGSTLYVDAWTTPAATTDYTVSGVALGDLAVVVEKFASTMKISITNNHATNVATMTLLKARGTPVIAGTPTVVASENQASIDDNGRSEYENASPWLPNTNTAQSYVDSIISVYKDPLGGCVLTFNVGVGGANSALFQDLMAREISDRVTVLAQEPMQGVGLAGDFFIEWIADHWDTQQSEHIVTMGLSAATAQSAAWILGTSVLGTSTVIGF